jgi:hypothetical protein
LNAIGHNPLAPPFGMKIDNEQTEFGSLPVLY